MSEKYFNIDLNKEINAGGQGNMQLIFLQRVNKVKT